MLRAIVKFSPSTIFHLWVWMARRHHITSRPSIYTYIWYFPFSKLVYVFTWTRNDCRGGQSWSVVLLWRDEKCQRCSKHCAVSTVEADVGRLLAYFRLRSISPCAGNASAYWQWAITPLLSSPSCCSVVAARHQSPHCRPKLGWQLEWSALVFAQMYQLYFCHLSCCQICRRCLPSVRVLFHGQCMWNCTQSADGYEHAHKLVYALTDDSGLQ